MEELCSGRIPSRTQLGAAITPQNLLAYRSRMTLAIGRLAIQSEKMPAPAPHSPSTPDDDESFDNPVQLSHPSSDVVTDDNVDGSPLLPDGSPILPPSPFIPPPSPFIPPPLPAVPPSTPPTAHTLARSPIGSPEDQRETKRRRSARPLTDLVTRKAAFSRDKVTNAWLSTPPENGPATPPDT